MTASPLSHAQRRLWVLDRMEPGSIAYNIPTAVRLRGALDVDALRRALRVVVDRHESLRTTFLEVEGEPRQAIGEGTDIALEEIDANALLEDARRPFDLAKGPLFRARLARLAPDDHVLALNLHHIIGDDWSAGVLLRDLALAYRGEALPPLPLQYRHFAAWHNAQLRRHDAEEHRAYWREKLAPPLPLLDLPTDSPRPEESRHEGARYDTMAFLPRVANATPFHVAVALTKVLLHRWTNQDDILIGTPIAGRDRAELENQIGCYVNTLVLRDTVRGDMTLRDVVDSVRRTAEEALAHATIPFDALLSDLALDRTLGRSPLFDVAVIWEEEDAFAPLPGLEVEPYDFGFATAKFDLSFYWSHGKLVIAYDTALFREETIARMAEHLATLAREIDTPIDTIEIEHGITINDAKFPDATLIELFEQQAARTPEHVAVIGRTTLTYRQLDARADAIAAEMRARGVARGQIVGVRLAPSEETVAALLAVLKCGCAYLPLDVEHPDERVKFMLEDAGAALLWGDGPAFDCAPRTQNGLAYVIYTSGSTGKPKGCAVTQRNVVSLLKNERFPFAFNDRDVWIVAHSFCFDFSVWEMYGALLNGGTLVVPPREDVRDVERFRELLRAHRVTILNQVPAAFLNLIAAESQHATHDLALRTVIFGGDRLEPTQLAPWLDWYPLDRVALVNMYGITETTVHVTYGPLSEDDIRGRAGRSPIGAPLPGVVVRVLNPARKLQPPGVTGELYVGGNGVCAGYVNRDALTAERFIEDPYFPGATLYRSGDLGRWTSSGTLEHLGRNDDQVQVRGFRIELREIEAALASHPNVSRALVSTRDGDLVAWIAGDADPDELRAHLRRTLPDYMLPAHFVSIDEVPLTSNNKIDWKSLPAPGAAPREDAVAPRDAIEHAVAAIWQRVLGLDSLSIHDNYFHLGGDSIKVIRITGAIASELGVRVEVKDLFRWPTVAELAEHIRSGSLRADPALDAAYETLDAMRDALLPRQDLNNDWEDVFPLSDIEQGMLFHASLDAAVYHDQFVFELRDDAYDDAYDHRAFTRAFELLVAKHPMLRTSFHLEGFDEPVQVVHRDLEVEIPFEDARFVADQETRLEALMRADRETPFDVTRPGLWRARVLRFAANRYAFVWAVHHAIVDGWSNASLFAELNETYARVKRGDDTPLPPLRATYRDFIADQLRWRASEPAREFWSRELDGWEHMRLPFGKDASSGPRGARRRTVHRVDPDVGQALATLARQEGLSPRDAWLAAFACLMELTTGRRELLFGIVTNNRPAIADGDAIFGCFLNSMPLRVALPFPRTPREILRTLADTLRRIKPHEMLPMRRIAEIAGATASSPFFDVLFNYIDFHVLERVATPRALYLYESTNTPLDVSISATLGDFSVATYWLDGIFTEDEIERLATYYARLLERFAATPDAPLTSDDILGAPDAIENWEPLPQTIDELFNEVALTFPDRPAVGAMTYAELDARSDALAAQLELEPEECVAVMGERSEETVVAFLAVIKAGGAYVPIDPDWPQPRIDYVLNDTRCRYFIRGGALA